MILQIENLTKKIKGVTVLDNINLPLQVALVMVLKERTVQVKLCL